MTDIGKWRLAGIFLLIALPLETAVWWFGIYSAGVTASNRTGLAFFLAPILAAAITGAWWRHKRGSYPDWSTRRPYSRLMGWLLFIVSALYFIPLTVVLIAVQSGAATDDLPALFLTAIALSFSAKTLPFLVLTIITQLLAAFIQTEIGLFLGTWIPDRLMRRHISAR